MILCRRFSGDPRTQQWLLELIVALNEAGKTIVLATHDLERLDMVADRCVVFSEGHRIVAEGSPGEILGDRDLLLGVNLIYGEVRNVSRTEYGEHCGLLGGSALSR